MLDQLGGALPAGTAPQARRDRAQALAELLVATSRSMAAPSSAFSKIEGRQPYAEPSTTTECFHFGKPMVVLPLGCPG